MTALAPGAISVSTVSGIANSSGLRASSMALSAALCWAYETGRVACCASPRTALLYSIPPIAFDVPLRANRCMK